MYQNTPELVLIVIGRLIELNMGVCSKGAEFITNKFAVTLSLTHSHTGTELYVVRILALKALKRDRVVVVF